MNKLEDIVDFVKKHGYLSKRKLLALLMQARAVVYQTLPAEWIEYKVQKPESSYLEVLGYHPDWVHPDFNPDGIRAGFQGESGFVSARWWNDQDCFDTDYSEPLYWKRIGGFKKPKI